MPFSSEGRDPLDEPEQEQEAGQVDAGSDEDDTGSRRRPTDDRSTPTAPAGPRGTEVAIACHGLSGVSGAVLSVSPPATLPAWKSITPSP